MGGQDVVPTRYRASRATGCSGTRIFLPIHLAFILQRRIVILRGRILLVAVDTFSSPSLRCTLAPAESCVDGGSPGVLNASPATDEAAKDEVAAPAEGTASWNLHALAAGLIDNTNGSSRCLTSPAGRSI